MRCAPAAFFQQAVRTAMAEVSNLTKVAANKDSDYKWARVLHMKDVQIQDLQGKVLCVDLSFFDLEQ